MVSNAGIVRPCKTPCEIAVKAGPQGPIRQKRLPLSALEVKPSFAAVPQIERNWTAHRPGTPSNLNGVGATKFRAPLTMTGMTVMNFRQLRISRRSAHHRHRFCRRGVAGDRRQCRAEQAGAGYRQGDDDRAERRSREPGLPHRTGDRQRPLPRRQRAAGPADQRRPRADRASCAATASTSTSSRTPAGTTCTAPSAG